MAYILIILKFLSFLGAFAKFLKATIISFVMSAWCPPVRNSAWNNSAHTGRILTKFDISTFWKSFKKVEDSVKSEKNDGYFS